MFETIIFYNLILILSTFFVFCSEKVVGKYNRTIFLALSFLAIFLPAAIRYNIGSDYWSYVELYNAVGSGDPVPIELGTFGLMYILNYLELSVEWFFVITSFIIYFIYFLSLPEKGAAIYHFAYMVTSYLVTYNLIRSALAFSFILLFIKLFLMKKNFYFLVIVFFAAFIFHKSSVLLIVLLAFIYFNISRIFNGFFGKILGIGFLIFCFLKIDYLILKIVELNILDIFGYGHYVETGYFQEVEMSTGLGFLLNISILFIPILIHNNIKNKMLYDKLVVNSSLLLLLASIAMASIGIFSRLQRFFIFGFIFSAHYMFFIEKKLLKSMAIIFLVFWGILFFEISIIKSKSDVCGGSRVSPYVSIFNKYDDKSWSGVSHEQCI